MTLSRAQPWLCSAVGLLLTSPAAPQSLQCPTREAEPPRASSASGWKRLGRAFRKAEGVGGAGERPSQAWGVHPVLGAPWGPGLGLTVRGPRTRQSWQGELPSSPGSRSSDEPRPTSASVCARHAFACGSGASQLSRKTAVCSPNSLRVNPGCAGVSEARLCCWVGCLGERRRAARDPRPRGSAAALLPTAAPSRPLATEDSAGSCKQKPRVSCRVEVWGGHAGGASSGMLALD